MNAPLPAAVSSSPAWHLALQAAALFAVDPAGLGGVHLRAPAGPVRDAWLQHTQGLVSPTCQRVIRIPVHASVERLLGGLDLAATLASGRPVVAQGLLAELDGHIAVLASAERCSAEMSHLLCQALDHRALRLERDGIAAEMETAFGLVALDEGFTDEEALPITVSERLALRVDLSGLRASEVLHAEIPALPIAAARALLAQVTIEESLLERLLATALALGIEPLRASLLATRAACVSAALAGRTQCDAEDIALAAQLVLAPRATRFPADAEMNEDETESPAESEPSPQDQEPPPEQPTANNDPAPEDDSDERATEMPDLDSVILAAVAAALPPGLLDALQRAPQKTRSPGAGGRSAAKQRSRSRGRPAGVLHGFPPGSRLALIDTLRTAAPMQTIRRREHAARGLDGGEARVFVRPSDFRAQRRRQARRSTTIFAVDTSGSAALQRLAEAKGAVERLLAECYIRRDQVALLTFRGSGAELCLPPTRSLPRARRALAGLPGGGGTPMAAGLIAARELAERVVRDGDSPLLVFLSDGRANVALIPDGSREAAREDALVAARQIAGANYRALFVDTAPRPQAQARALADAMAAHYLPLPALDAGRLNHAIRQLTD